MREISGTEARRIALSHQGLHATKPFGTGKNGVLNAVRRLGYVQLDTISVTERAHDHILWTRVPGYRHRHLTDLQVRDRQIFEFWAHAAAFLPIEDYRYCIPTMHYFRDHHDPWPKSDTRTMKAVLDRIRLDGPLMSRDFENPKKAGATGWWDWKPTKLALQRLFFSGALMVSHRTGFQRVYDLPERVLPGGLDTSPPSTEEYAQYLIRRTIAAHGFARAAEISYLRKGMGAPVRTVLRAMTEAGELIPVRVKGVDSEYYTTEGQLNSSVRMTKMVRLLSPFDNTVIQRERLRDLFGFDYQVEVYVPQAKRKYGYYSLPVLYGDAFYGRVDVKAERKSKTLSLVHVHFEDKKQPAGFLEAFAEGCHAFAEFNGCTDIRVIKVTPDFLGKELRRQLEI